MNSNYYKVGFRKLEAWNQARILRQQIIEDCKDSPKEERFLLIPQLKVSSRSVTANISKGYGRYHYQETTQFFRNSRGSLNETPDHLTTGFDEGYISKEKFQKREKQYEKTLKLINGHISFLQKAKQSQSSVDLPNTE